MMFFAVAGGRITQNNPFRDLLQNQISRKVRAAGTDKSHEPLTTGDSTVACSHSRRCFSLIAPGWRKPIHRPGQSCHRSCVPQGQTLDRGFIISRWEQGRLAGPTQNRDILFVPGEPRIDTAIRRDYPQRFVQGRSGRRIFLSVGL